MRSGKTHLSYWMWLKIISESDGPFLLTAKTNATLRRNVLDPMRGLFGKKIVGEARGDGTVQIAGKLHYIICANDERARERIQGSSFQDAYGDEVTTWPYSFFQMLQSRLDKPGARFLGTYNPEGPYHWLKTDFIDKSKDLNVNDIRFRLDDNSFLDPVFVASLKAEYTGVWYQRYIEGLWAASEGIIYDMFTDAHVFTELPSGVKPTLAWMTIDYGTSNPFVALINTLSNDGVFRTMREYRWDGRAKHRQMTDSEYAEHLKLFVNDFGMKLQCVIVDPSAASMITELRRRVWWDVKLGINDVLDGIRYTSSMLCKRQLLIHLSCEGLINEMRSYAWDAKATRATGIDTPLKEADHGPDAERYFVNTIASKLRIKG